MPATPRTVPAQSGLTRRYLVTAGALTMAGIAARSTALAKPDETLSHTEEAIHQVRMFGASAKQVYEALTVQSQFDRVVQLSGVMKADAMANMRKPTALSSDAGGAFALFGGYIVGRQIELVPDKLIVQAWRVLSWARGVYSIARFELTDQGGSTRLVFDHTAFPKGEAEHLASGWQEHYWDPLTQLLA
jgi:activator of HSP90 ATPase